MIITFHLHWWIAFINLKSLESYMQIWMNETVKYIVKVKTYCKKRVSQA